MNGDNRKDIQEENELLENYTGASSSSDCTGLIPAGGNRSAEEFDNYKDIYPFAIPKKISEYKDEEAKRLNKQ